MQWVEIAKFPFSVVTAMLFAPVHRHRGGYAYKTVFVSGKYWLLTTDKGQPVHRYVADPTAQRGAAFGVDNAQESDVEYGSGNPFADLGVPGDEDLASMRPWEAFVEMDVEDNFDPIVQSGRAGTFRTTEAWADNPTYIGFEPDMYSGFGRAPIVGCDDYGMTRG